jgi:hypothetical protein
MQPSHTKHLMMLTQPRGKIIPLQNSLNLMRYVTTLHDFLQTQRHKWTCARHVAYGFVLADPPYCRMTLFVTKLQLRTLHYITDSYFLILRTWFHWQFGHWSWYSSPALACCTKDKGHEYSRAPCCSLRAEGLYYCVSFTLVSYFFVELR